MTIEGLQNYLGTRLLLQISAKQHLKSLGMVFALVFTSSIVIHLLVHLNISPVGMVTHAIVIGAIYTIGIGIAITLLHIIGSGTNDVRVWQVWVVSVASFIIGYYFIPIDDHLVRLLGIETEEHMSPAGIWSLVPAWFLVTYFFIQPFLNDALKSELARLRRINVMLENRDSDPGQTGQPLIHFESGRTEFTLRSDTIQNIVVEDHYCYVHYLLNGKYIKRDLAMPLRDVLTLLPTGFARVHRSHIVNLRHVKSIQRKNRSNRLILESGYEVPVSRHRLDEVLPLIQQTMESRIH